MTASKGKYQNSPDQQNCYKFKETLLRMSKSSHLHLYRAFNNGLFQSSFTEI